MGVQLELLRLGAPHLVLLLLAVLILIFSLLGPLLRFECHKNE